MVLSKSEAPVPQLAPKPIGLLDMDEIKFTIDDGLVPIIVCPAVSKLIVPIQGRSTCENASAAATNSSGADIVSNHKTSAPPSLRP